MEMYSIQLGKAGPDGFKAIESQKALASNLDEIMPRAVDMLRTRGVQLGANRLQVVVEPAKVVWEYP